MKTEHTPGPWQVRQGVGPFSDRENDYQPFDICTENFSELYDAGKRICTLSDGWSKEDKANARLIAAAPEMLEALNLALATIERLKPPTPYDSTQGTRDVINAAIAKAEGKD